MFRFISAMQGAIDTDVAYVNAREMSGNLMTGHSSSHDDRFELDDLNNVFTDGLFESLSKTGPYMFPDPKEIGTDLFRYAHFAAQTANAHFIQPGLLTLQPSLEEILRSLDDDEPFPTSSGVPLHSHSPPLYAMTSHAQSTPTFYVEAQQSTSVGKGNRVPSKYQSTTQAVVSNSVDEQRMKSEPPQRTDNTTIDRPPTDSNAIAAATILMNCSRNSGAVVVP